MGAEPDVLLPTYRGKNHAEYDAGAIGSRECWARIFAEAGIGIDWQVAFAAGLAALGVKDEAMVSFARGPNRPGLAMGMPSNTSRDFVGRTGWHSPRIDELFDPALFSCRLRLAKPDEEVFTIALARLSRSAGRKLTSEDVLFVDDSSKNVEAVKKLGFLGHCPENLEALSAKVESI